MTDLGEAKKIFGMEILRDKINCDHDKSRSFTDYVFTIGGCAISWKATLKSMVTLSTTEAKYIAITEAFKEAI
ncbi:hypothetical protein CQW23_35298 [Capsicum baccatum]|uniref:Retrovirus-related Pol polyprotein from transposon TNT 1-94 n=1 Tax=Capsicum baccatum TaxID=33114 RepID=A0A2G2UWE5_CAPBA|nr:hypothetical protein CQW23_35298 [Capsicum baccatum]